MKPSFRNQQGFFHLRLLVLLKPLKNMENVKLVFFGTEESGTEFHQLECFANTKDEIYISVHIGDELYPYHICLSEKTAVKLSKELRKQIGILKGFNNG